MKGIPDTGGSQPLPDFNDTWYPRGPQGVEELEDLFSTPCVLGSQRKPVSAITALPF